MQTTISVAPRLGYGQPVHLLAVTCLLICACMELPESSFELSPDSRLPKWFTLPQGISRSSVSVSMDYYLGRTVRFKMLDAKKRELAEATGVEKGLKPLQLKSPPPGFPSGYPAFEIVDVNGIREVIEHRRMEPIFYISDDPAVLAELGVTRNVAGSP